MTVFPKVIELLNQRGASDIKVMGGGIIPADDIAELERSGVTKLFTSGAPTSQIVEFVRSLVLAC